MMKHLQSIFKLVSTVACSIFVYTTSAQSTPDLVLSSLSCNYDDQTAILSNISYTMKNQGNFTTFGSVTNKLFIVDIGSGSWQIGDNQTESFGLAAGASETLTIADVDLDTVLTQSGTYYLKVTIDVNNEESESNESNNVTTSSGSSGSFNFIALVGIKEHNKSNDINFKCYPNPAQETTTISFTTEKGGNFKLEIFDVNGKNVLTLNDFETTAPSTFHAKQIDISSLQDGLYLCKLTGEKSVVTEKLVIRK